MVETTDAGDQGYDKSLVGAKEFRVTVGNLLCRDKIS